ncbi:MAG: S41 family peptidase [Clostridium sp.]
MKKKSYIILGALIILGIIGYIAYDRYDYTRVVAPNKLSKKDKVEDFNQLYTTIVEGYPFLEVNKRMNGVDFAAKKEEYLKKIKRANTDSRFESELHSIVKDLNNGHSEILTRDGISTYQSAYAYIEPVKSIYKDLFYNDKVIERYGKVPPREKLQAMEDSEESELVTKDVINNKVAYMYIPSMLGSEVTINKDMKVIEEYISTRGNYDSLIIDIRGNGGGSTSYWLPMLSMLTNKPLQVKQYGLFRANNPVVKEYAFGRVKPELFYSDVTKASELRVITSLPSDSMKNIPSEAKSIFSHYFELITNISPKGNSGFKGKVYLLVDKEVYSSAEAFAVFCKESGYATIVGEKTGGDGIGIDPLLFNLKNSGIVVRMPSDMGLSESGVCNEEFKTTPDIEVKDCTRTRDYETDKSIQRVLELEKINNGKN